MTRICNEPGCGKPLAAHNLSGLCTVCGKKKRLADYVRGCERERESWYRQEDDVSPETILRIATGVRV